MRILSITAQKPHSTGSGTYMTELVRSFARAGHTQAVVFGSYPDDTVSFPQGVRCCPVHFTDTSTPGIVRFERGLTFLSEEFSCLAPHIEKLPFPVTGMSDIMPYTSTRYRDLTDEMIRQFEHAFTETIRRAISDLDPDLIICHHLFLLTAMVRRHFPGKRIFGISHGTDLRQMMNCPSLAAYVRPQIAKLDMALALHEDQAETIKDIFGLDDSRVRVIGSGYNSRLFNTEGRTAYRPGEPVRLCYAGKISRPKGVPEMLEALSALDADPSVPPFRLTMAGGCQDETLKDAIEHLPRYAEWLGQIPQSELAELMRRSDIFILPSFFEGLPLVLIEAMACGAVPVSTDLPGVRDWIDANVSHPNVRYAAMPEMKSIDEPTERGRRFFISELIFVLKSAISEIASGRAAAIPDTSGISWDRLAERLIDLNL